MGEFVMPSLGADMDAGTLVEWLKQPGETVHHGDVIAVVETQKGAIEVEVFQDGEIRKLLVEEGTKVPVGTPLAVIGGEGEEPTAAVEAPAEAAAPAPAPAEAATAPAEAAPAPSEPAVQPPPPPPSGRSRASPAARRLAAERGVDLETLSGSGPDRAVVARDVETAMAEAKAETPAHPARPRLDLAEMRKAIAAAMAKAKREIPHYYLSHEVDIEAAQAFLDKENAERAPDKRLLLSVLLLKATALALKKHTQFNGFYTDGEFRKSERIHVGAAVAIRGGGLVAPAIHDLDQASLDTIMDRLRDLVARVRTGTLRSSELSDPTVTVSSLGERGVDALYGVIYPPQVALVGFGTPNVRPRVVEGRIEPRRALTASLAADHRVSDGHRGALFLAEIDRLLQEPETL
ncbi:dihydrolipoamide acetyltransferase family protein [Ferruginivarius sediminum]|uniref:Dihydrolipoamide acetyltransferase component of pyruvate dehydrogenase complex n=1 Tax=Ferruginivarius sediminum TaxID=2661937 RepID=A0A369T975_9PROT|nr:dihydrolipoamide acetyltransferase family protein [Ferruginivarius sediminum]RDD61034.1 2-oxo acid dehydrogenase subunit E2 [Ferruginivarius sediminum]